MGIFTGPADYDRNRIMEAASRARARRRFRKATVLYRRVLAVEPANVELHAKLAPLLAVTGCEFDAWRSFRVCARAALSEKQLGRAAAVYREAARCLPRQIEAWEKLARVEQQRGRKPEALEALLEGRLWFRGRRRRAEAIALLRCARELEPGNLAIALDLSQGLARTRQGSEAQLLLDRLAERAGGRDRRRIRGAQWRIAPTLVNTWRWLRAACSPAKAGDRVRIAA